MGRGQCHASKHVMFLATNLYHAGPAQRSTRRSRQLERLAITKTLQECGGNRTHAAARLGISVRTLQRKLRQYEMDGGRDTTAPGDVLTNA